MILGLVEHDRGKVSGGSMEMLTFARHLADRQDCPLHAVLIDNGTRPLAEALRAYGVTAVYLVEHERLDDYAPEAWAQSVVGVIAATHPQAVMAPGSDRGHEVMAHVAARTGLPLAANCTEVALGDPCRVTRLRWGGSLLEEAQFQGSPALVTIAEHVVEAKQAPAEELVIHEITPTLADADFRVRIIERVEATGGRVSPAEARVVVGGGRGVGSAEGFHVLEELAALLGGAVGCSRAVTSLGWRPHADQIGQTGMRIAPDLYIACGVSGAIQHMVGCKGAKIILAVNTDPDAPIITEADYAVIGDLHQVVPALCEAIRRAQR
jgi:electron transfer flavoprotein alpha subunit